MEEVLALKHISFAYAGKKSFFNDLSFSLSRGEFKVIAGCNGSGKSTLMRLASGLIAPQSGSVLLKGLPVKNYSSSRRASLLGYVPQYLPDSAGMTVKELVLTGRAGKNALFGQFLPSARDLDITFQALCDMDIEHLAERSCESLSGGEFKRVSIAAILAQEAEILLLDEPCSFLDYPHGERLMMILEKLVRERAFSICMISHDLILPAKYASCFLLMKEGRILAEGPTEKILTPENLQNVYSCPFEVLKDSCGNCVPVVKNF